MYQGYLEDRVVLSCVMGGYVARIRTGVKVVFVFKRNADEDRKACLSTGPTINFHLTGQ
jgi:hypothetical protein